MENNDPALIDTHAGMNPAASTKLCFAGFAVADVQAALASDEVRPDEPLLLVHPASAIAATEIVMINADDFTRPA